MDYHDASRRLTDGKMQERFSPNNTVQLLNKEKNLIIQITVDMKLTNSQISFGNMTFKSYSPFSVFQY